VKSVVNIPVVANGDITSPEKARDVLNFTGADAIMVGRAAQGKPWIFREIAHFMATGVHLAPPLVEEVKKLLCDHLLDHYHLYGEFAGVRTARKHIGWYVRSLPGGQAFQDEMNSLETCEVQHAAVAQFFDDLAEHYERLPKVIETEQDQLDEVLS
jgi:tRNA-dihydrouridine synthase B